MDLRNWRAIFSFIWVKGQYQAATYRTFCYEQIETNFFVDGLTLQCFTLRDQDAWVCFWKYWRNERSNTNRKKKPIQMFPNSTYHSAKVAAILDKARTFFAIINTEEVPLSSNEMTERSVHHWAFVYVLESTRPFNTLYNSVTIRGRPVWRFRCLSHAKKIEWSALKTTPHCLVRVFIDSLFKVCFVLLLFGKSQNIRFHQSKWVCPNTTRIFSVVEL